MRLLCFQWGERGKCTNETSSHETETVVAVEILDLIF